MATTCFGQEHLDSAELAAFVPDEAPIPGIAAAPDEVAGLEHPDPSARLTVPTTVAGESLLTLDQMVASVQDGLLMVFGPEGDPVPPQAFADAIAREPEAVVMLSDGAAVPASRVAIVLKAQTLGRLGAAEDGGWIMTMLRDQDRPEAASEQDLASEHDDFVLISTGDETPPDQPSAPGLEQVEPPSPSPGLDLAGSVAGSAGPADAVDADSIVLVTIRGVPDDVQLSAGVRDDDGSWSLSPLDLPDLTITPASGEGSAAEIADRELTITGIALTDGGALTAFTETVPLADYLIGAARERSEESVTARQAPGDRQAASGPTAIALEVDPALWRGEEFDALVVRDLPAGARLSVGAHDPAIDGWVLQPQDLRALAIIPPADQRTDFTLTLLGVVLRPGDANAARVLTRLPVRLT